MRAYSKSGRPFFGGMLRNIADLFKKCPLILANPSGLLPLSIHHSVLESQAMKTTPSRKHLGRSIELGLLLIATSIGVIALAVWQANSL